MIWERSRNLIGRFGVLSVEKKVSCLSGAKVPWETRLGDIGESEVKTHLAYFSIPTKLDRDVGIDFYCELIEQDYPTLPFYVQAKGTEHFDENWSGSIKKSTVLYWLQQKHPVFLVVSDIRKGECYWMSIEDHRYSLLEKLASRTSSDTVSFVIDRSQTLEKGRNDEFIRKVEEDTASIERFHGRPRFKGKGYVKRVPEPPRSDIELKRTRGNIRAYAYSLAIHYMLLNDLQNAHMICDFLTKFDKSHYNHFVWFGRINKMLGKPRKAKRYFREALSICKKDKVWPRDSMQNILEYIKREIESL